MNPTYDLILKGGRLIEPSSARDEICDIGILNQRVAFIGRNVGPVDAKNVLDLRGHVVCPGLIDAHVHIGKHVSPIGVDADIAGVLSGVTTVCDAGSAGYKNFSEFVSKDVQGNQTEVFCFINLCPEGLQVFPEKWRMDELNNDAIIRKIMSNRDLIKGVKLRATGDFINKIGLNGIARAKEIGRQTGLPLMVHVGIEPNEKIKDDLVNFTRNALDYLEGGDIIAHGFTAKEGGPIRIDGACDRSLRSAVKRGVILDAAIARTNFNVKIFQTAIQRGFYPDIISTDLCTLNIEDTTFNLSYTMSKFLALGLPLSDIVKMTTLNPAAALGIQKGRIFEGAVADITVMKIIEGDFQFDDGPWANRFQGDKLIVADYSIKNGEVMMPTVCTNFIERIQNGTLAINAWFG